jgi:Domain of unknown function (DUF6429)
MWQALATAARNCTIARMEYDEDKVDEMALALLFLTLRDGDWAWKGHDWSAVDRLHKKGMIANPLEKAKSVALTEEGDCNVRANCSRSISPNRPHSDMV